MLSQFSFKGIREGALLIFMLLVPGITALANEKVYTVEKHTSALYRTFHGKVEAIAKATASAETSGRVEEVLFDIGDKVPAGSVIVRLVAVEQNQQLNQSRAAVAEATANLSVADKQYQRVRSLYRQKLLPKARLDEATAELTGAKARLASSKAALKTAEQQVSYTEVKAAYSGVVSAKHVEAGEAVQPGTPLMSGFDPNRLRVNIDLPQSMIDRSVSDPFVPSDFTISYDNQSIEPANIKLYPVADSLTASVRARLALSGIDGLYPGRWVKVIVKYAEAEKLMIPVNAVVYRSELAAVYVLNDGKALLRQVRLGARDGERIELLAGLEEGEAILTDPFAVTRFNTAKSGGSK